MNDALGSIIITFLVILVFTIGVFIGSAAISYGKSNTTCRTGNNPEICFFNGSDIRCVLVRDMKNK
jgi:hypothetical protein